MSIAVRRLVLLAILCAAGVALLALFFYGSDRFNHYDSTLTADLLAPTDSLRHSIAELWSDSANPVPLALFLAAVSVLGIIWKRPWHLLAAGGVVLMANLSTQVMKALLAHPRLQGALGASYPIEIGYPSGHTTAAVSAGFALWLVAPRRLRGWAALAGAAYASIVAAGVVVAGWHFISDVLGAVMVVGFWAALAMAALLTAGLESPSGWIPERESNQPSDRRSGSRRNTRPYPDGR